MIAEKYGIMEKVGGVILTAENLRKRRISYVGVLCAKIQAKT